MHLLTYWNQRSIRPSLSTAEYSPMLPQLHGGDHRDILPDMGMDKESDHTAMTKSLMSGVK